MDLAAMVFGVVATVALSSTSKFRAREGIIFSLYAVGNVLFIAHSVASGSLGVLIFNLVCLGLNARALALRAVEWVRSRRPVAQHPGHSSRDPESLGELAARPLASKILVLLSCAESREFRCDRRSVYGAFTALAARFPGHFGCLPFEKASGTVCCEELDLAFGRLLSSGALRRSEGSWVVLDAGLADRVPEEVIPELGLDFISDIPRMLPLVEGLAETGRRVRACLDQPPEAAGSVLSDLQ